MLNIGILNPWILGTIIAYVCGSFDLKTTITTNKGGAAVLDMYNV